MVAKPIIESNTIDWTLSKLLLLVPFLFLSTGIALAAPGDLCIESYDCTLELMAERPFDAGLVAFDFVIEGFGLLIVWGPIVMAIWILSKDALLTGMFGVIVASVMVGLNPTAVSIGMMLFAVCLAIAMFTLFPRLKNVA